MSIQTELFVSYRMGSIELSSDEEYPKPSDEEFSPIPDLSDDISLSPVQSPNPSPRIELPEDPFYTFLKDAKLDEYWGQMQECGYDDFDYFAKEMDETDVDSMSKTVGIAKKPGHHQKFMSRWRILRHGKSVPTSPTPSSQPTDASTSLPREIKALLLPSPITAKNQFFNEITMEIYQCNSALMNLSQLCSYIRSQRETRFRVTEKVEVVRKILRDCEGKWEEGESPDGHYVIVKKFISAISVNHGEAVKAKKAFKFLQNKVTLVENLIQELKEAKMNILKGEVKDWKANELEFYGSQLKLLSDMIKVVSGYLTKIGDLMSSSHCISSLVEVEEKKQQQRSVKKNSLKTQTRKDQRTFTSAELVLTIVLKDSKSKYPKSAGSGDFSFTIINQDIEFSKFRSLVHKMHSRGLKLLLEKKVFHDHQKVKRYADIMENKYLQQQKEKNQTKLRLAEKAKEKAKQQTISFGSASI